MDGATAQVDLPNLCWDYVEETRRMQQWKIVFCGGWYERENPNAPSLLLPHEVYYQSYYNGIEFVVVSGNSAIFSWS